MNFRNCIMTCLAGAALAAVAATAQSPADGAPTGAPASTPPKAPVRIPTAPDVLVVEKVDVAAGEVHGVIERSVVKEVTETRVRKVQRALVLVAVGTCCVTTYVSSTSSSRTEPSV